ncbi:MAG: peptidylprolyl isomerase [Verrucomicrobia bacterium]|nr:peptidylprolyl isomerase [Verrucomicrobiota bacterium]
MTKFHLSATILSPVAAAALVLLPACKPAPAPVEAPAKPAPTAAPTATPTAAPTATAAPAPATNAAAPSETSAPSVDLKDPVAKVNGEDITKAQVEEAFAAAVQASGVKAADLTADQKLNGYRQILDELIMDKLVAKAAAGETVSDEDITAEIAKLKKQFPTEEAFEAQLKEAGQSPDKLKTALRTMLQQQRWMQSQIKDGDKITDADAKKFYDTNTEEFKNPETVKASHILFMVNKDDSEEVVKQKEAAAKKAAARAKKGEDFSKLAKELSEEPGAKDSGGDLGFFAKDRMVPEFAEAAFSQKPGTISDPVKTQFGWHVIKVTEKKPAGTVPFEEVKDQITAYLKSAKQREAVQAILKKLKDSAQIESTLPPAN